MSQECEVELDMTLTSSELERCLGLNISSHLFTLQYLFKTELMTQGFKTNFRRGSWTKTNKQMYLKFPK